MADSRLSWRGGSYADMAVKTHELDHRTIAASAGLGIVGITAAELTRSILGQTDAHSGQSPGLWLSVRVFAHFASIIRDELRIAHEERGGPAVADNEFAIAGFFEDGTPGVATLLMAKSGSAVSFRRPREDAELACVVIGESSVKDLVYFTYLEAAKKNVDFHEPVASAFWYLISAGSESMRGIGGGLAIGICLQDPRFRMTWPLVEVDGVRYYRGVPVAARDVHADGRSAVWRLAIDMNESARLDRLIEDLKLSSCAARGKSMPHADRIPQFECTLDDLFKISPLHYAPEPDSLQG